MARYVVGILPHPLPIGIDPTLIRSRGTHPKLLGEVQKKGKGPKKSS